MIDIIHKRSINLSSRGDRFHAVSPHVEVASGSPGATARKETDTPLGNACAFPLARIN